MHARAIHVHSRFRHKSSVKSVALCNRPHNHLKSHQLIGNCQGVLKRKINLMLRRSNLMVRRINLIPHFLQSQDDVAPRILSQIYR